MKEDNKIRFRDLSIPMKIAVILSYIFGTISVIGFLVGFFTALIKGV